MNGIVSNLKRALSSLRKVKYGDIIKSDDHNTVVDSITNLNELVCPSKIDISNLFNYIFYHFRFRHFDTDIFNMAFYSNTPWGSSIRTVYPYYIDYDGIHFKQSVLPPPDIFTIINDSFVLNPTWFITLEDSYRFANEHYTAVSPYRLKIASILKLNHNPNILNKNIALYLQFGYHRVTSNVNIVLDAPIYVVFCIEDGKIDIYYVAYALPPSTAPIVEPPPTTAPTNYIGIGILKSIYPINISDELIIERVVAGAGDTTPIDTSNAVKVHASQFTTTPPYYALAKTLNIDIPNNEWIVLSVETDIILNVSHDIENHILPPIEIKILDKDLKEIGSVVLDLNIVLP